MEASSLPDVATRKLLALTNEAEQLAAAAAKTGARQNDTSGSPTAAEAESAKAVDALNSLKAKADIGAAQAAHRAACDRAERAQSTLGSVRHWLSKLPGGTVLEPYAVKPEPGDTLAKVRARRSACIEELAELRATPIAGADIKQRVQAYVKRLARDTAPAHVDGLQKGGSLRVDWRTADPAFAFIAKLFPEEIEQQIMQQIEHQTKGQDRQRITQRKAALKRELDEIPYREEALVERFDQRDLTTMVAAAVLGVRVVVSRQHSLEAAE